MNIWITNWINDMLWSGSRNMHVDIKNVAAQYDQILKRSKVCPYFWNFIARKLKKYLILKQVKKFGMLKVSYLECCVIKNYKVTLAFVPSWTIDYSATLFSIFCGTVYILRFLLPFFHASLKYSLQYNIILLHWKIVVLLRITSFLIPRILFALYNTYYKMDASMLWSTLIV